MEYFALISRRIVRLEANVDMFFNYVGNLDIFDDNIDILSIRNTSTDNILPGDININVYQRNDQIECLFHIEQSVECADKTKDLAIKMKECLIEVIDFCTSKDEVFITASDVSNDGLSMNDFENILDMLYRGR